MAGDIVSELHPEKSCFRNNHYKHKQHQPGALHTAIKGSINELRACSYFLSLGYEVFRNVCPTGDGDIIVWKRGTDPVVIDVKAIYVPEYTKKDGTKNTNQTMQKSKCPGVITVGVTEDGEVVCDGWTPKNHRF